MPSMAGLEREWDGLETPGPSRQPRQVPVFLLIMSVTRVSSDLCPLIKAIIGSFLVISVLSCKWIPECSIPKRRSFPVGYTVVGIFA
jgi:hypothetical protein